MTAAVAALVGATALPAAAQFRNADAAIQYRQAVMVVQQFHLGRIFAMANGRMPFDPKVVMDDANVLATIDVLPFVAFGPGTDKGNTNALPAVWSERAKFDAAAKQMQDEVAKLVTASKTGNIDQVKVAVGAAAQSCKSCHDNFRKE
jgi:cytochrome c556